MRFRLPRIAVRGSGEKVERSLLKGEPRTVMEDQSGTVGFGLFPFPGLSHPSPGLAKSFLPLTISLGILPFHSGSSSVHF